MHGSDLLSRGQHQLESLYRGACLAGLLGALAALLNPGVAWSQPVNLAVLTGAKAEQSSTDYGAPASRAIDGNTEGNYHKGSVTHTGNQANAWWQLTLRKPAPISSIVLWNRTDCCMERLANIRVTLLDSDREPVWTKDWTGGEEPDPSKQRKTTITLPEATTARFVKIELLPEQEGQPVTDHYLSLAEVQVFGEEPLEERPRIVEAHQYTVTLTTTQVVKSQDSNPTTSPRKITTTRTTKTTFDSKSAVESIKESTKSTRFNISGTASATISGSSASGISGSGSVSSTVGHTYENLVKTFYKTSGEVKEFKSKEDIRQDVITLNPGDSITIYTNTTTGGSYEYSWETSEPLSEEDARPVTVTFTVEYDLTPLFNELMSTVMKNNNGISTDKGEWVEYAKICEESMVKGIRHYTKEVGNRLWTTGLDQYSWKQVKAAAHAAALATDDSIALATILLGTYRITQPSHNAWAWNNLKAVASKYMTSQSAQASR